MARRGFARHSLQTRITLSTLAIFLASLWALSFLASQILREDIEELLGKQQFSTASFIASEIDAGLNERLRALSTVAERLAPVLGGSERSVQTFLDERWTLANLFSGGVYITRANGSVIADVPKTRQRVGLNYAATPHVAAALAGTPAISAPFFGKTMRAPVVVIVVPIKDRDGRVVGVLAGVTDLTQPNFLDTIAANRYGLTGGYLLIDPKTRQIVTSTNRRLIMQPAVPAGSHAAIDRFLSGQEGSAIHVNPVGVEMLSSAKRIAAAGWYVVADLPTAEAFALIANVQWRMWLATVFLTLLAGAVTWWLLRRNLAPLLATVDSLAAISEAKQPLQALPIVADDEIGKLIGGFNHLLAVLGKRDAALRENEEQLVSTQRHARIGYWEMQGDGQSFAWSPQVYELLGLPHDLPATPETLARIANPDVVAAIYAALLASLDSGEETLTEFCVRRPDDGTTRWMDCRGKAIVSADGQSRKIIGFVQDVTERKRSDASLRSSEERYRIIFQTNLDLISINRVADGVFVDVNQAYLETVGYAYAEIVGHSSLELNIWADAQDRQFFVDVLQRESRIVNYETRFRKKNGDLVWGLMSAALLELDGVLCVLSVIRDITERKLAEEKLHLAASVFSHAREGIMITAADGTIIDTNEAFNRITGYPRDEVLGQNPRLLRSGRHDAGFYAAMWRALAEKGHWYGEVWNRRKNGEIFAGLQTISTVHDGQGRARHFVSLFSDITALKEHENQLLHMAHFDVLTKLPNRVLLADRLHQAMAQALRRKQRLAVAYLDLDGFKAINDGYGHQVGDQVLMGLAARMKLSLREGDTLARLGGDEFVAVLLDLADIDASVPMLTRLLSAAAEPLQIGESTLVVSASLGVTFYPQHDEADADQLLRQADQAMYQAKLAGKNRYHVFDADQDRSLRGRHENIERIRRALTDGEFELYYQPKVNMRSGAVIGAEALIRWRHPDKGLLPPSLFLPVVEDHALAVDIGEWVLASALTQIERWRGVGLDIPISVNVGARQLQRSDFIERLYALLVSHPAVRPGDLALEILETSAFEDLARVSQIIEACRTIGVSFALDDFGTGYSSLTYLKRLKVAQLKIDRSFVHDMLDDPDDLAILEGILGLATAFGHETIAEGVETVEHGTMLLQLGCELAQGYCIARPMAADQLPAWAAAWRPDPAWSEPWAVHHDDRPLLVATVEQRAWIAGVEAVQSGERQSLPAIQQQCRLCSWLAADGQTRHGEQGSFVELAALHRQTHVLAAQLGVLPACGWDAQALVKLAELRAVGADLLAQLQSLTPQKRNRA